MKPRLNTSTPIPRVESTRPQRDEIGLNTTRNLQRLATLYAVGKAITSRLELNEVCRLIVREVATTLGYGAAAVLLLDREREELFEIAYHGAPLQRPDARLKLGEGLVSRAVLSGKAQITSDVTLEPAYVPGLRGCRSEADIPIKLGDEVIGVLLVEDVQANAYSQEDVSLLTAVADQVAVAIENARLYELYDELESRVEERTANLMAANEALQREIAERERVEEQLRLQSTALESMANAIVITDREGRITWINPAFTRLTGYTAEETLGQSLRLLKSGVHGPSFYQNLWQTILSGQVWHGEIINRRKDGNLYTEEMTITPLQDARGETTHFIAIKQDVTKRVQAEERLEASLRKLIESEKRYRTLVNLVPDMIYLLDSDGRIVFVNRGVEALGYAPTELLGRRFEEIVHPDDIKKAGDRFVERRVGERATSDLELRLLTKHGEVRDHAARCVEAAITMRGLWDVPDDQIEQREKTFLGTLGIARDVTERVRAEEALRKAHDELERRVEERTAELSKANVLLKREIAERKRVEEKLRQQELDRLRSELIANVSHELRTPLGLIKIFCTTLLREDVDFEPETQREFLRHIDEEADKLEKIVDNLLDLSRMESERLRLDRRPTDIGRLAREVIEAMKMETDVQTTQQQLVHDFPADPVVATVDARRIEQVLRNLLSNAIKYSPEGGTIRVQGHRDEGQVLIAVRDQGIGIPSQDLERVFERFYRVENAITRRTRGVGLGLAVCRGIVEAHGGRIWAESILGEGSTFYFTLPVGESANQRINESANR